MCGIAGVFIRDLDFVKKPEGLEVFCNSLLKAIENRGKHATGFVAIPEQGAASKIVFEKAANTASVFIRERSTFPDRTKTVLLHTRHRTKGSENDIVNNHPVVHKSCFTVHNGHVNNDDYLFEETGYERKGEVDSEIIPALLAHADWTPEGIRQQLEKIKGAMAIAATDVENFRDKVLLARGDLSPLYYIDAGKFVAWASTAEALRDAWGATLGTPPNVKRIPEARLGDFFIVSDEPTVEKHVFIPGEGWDWPKGVGFGSGSRKMIGPGSYGGTQSGASKTSGENGSAETESVGCMVGDKPGLLGFKRENGEIRFPEIPPSYFEQIKALDVRERTQSVRAANEGISKLRPPHMLTTDKYRMCWTCNQVVAEDDLVTHNGTPSICLDCVCSRIAIWDELRAKGDRQAHHKPEWLSRQAVDDLHDWAEVDDYVHCEVLKSLEEIMGLHRDLLEAMVFRIPPEMAKYKHSDFGALCEMVTEEYDRLYLAEWEMQDDGAMVRADGWVEALDGAAKTMVGAEESRPEVDSKQCSCGTYIYTGRSMCRVCARREKREQKIHEHPFLNCDSSPEQCVICTRAKAKSWITGHGMVVGYCLRHVGRCAQRGCKAVTNHTASDGKRYCHKHSRSRSDVRADSVLLKPVTDGGLGYALVEELEVPT